MRYSSSDDDDDADNKGRDVSASDEGTGPNLLPDVGKEATPTQARGPIEPIQDGSSDSDRPTHLEGKDGSAAANEPQSLSPESKKPKICLYVKFKECP